jgi:hypothetical protein
MCLSYCIDRSSTSFEIFKTSENMHCYDLSYRIYLFQKVTFTRDEEPEHFDAFLYPFLFKPDIIVLSSTDTI